MLLGTLYSNAGYVGLSRKHPMKCIVLATGFWAARISEISKDDTVLIIGGGPTGICTLLCVMLHHPKHIILCEKSEERREFIRTHYPQIQVVHPDECQEIVGKTSENGGADRVLEVAGSSDTFRLAWECARPNGIVTVVALYNQPQILPLPDMYGKNLTFKTGGVDGCDCEEVLCLTPVLPNLLLIIIALLPSPIIVLPKVR